MNLRVLAVTLFAACALPLYAHPGHSLTEHGISHLVASPYHVLTVIIVGLTLLAIGSMLKNRIVSGFLTIVGIAAIGAGAADLLLPR